MATEANKPATGAAAAAPPASKTAVAKTNAAPAYGAEPGENGSIVLKLRRAVPSGDKDKTTDRLTFREPTAGDIAEVGCPVLTDAREWPPKLTFDEPKMSAMMVLLAAVPPSTIKAMHPKDWMNGAWALLDFFTPDLR